MPSLRPSSLPFLGAGLGYRGAVHQMAAQRPDILGFWEVMPEHVLEGNQHSRGLLEQATANVPVVTHSVTLSVGTATGPDRAFLPKFRKANRHFGVPWASDHLCFTKIGKRTIGQLTPIPYTDESLAVCTRNIEEVQAALGVPFLIENISQYFQYPGNTIEEPDFFTELTKKTGCGVLLDVTNLRNNVHNLGVNPHAYLDRFPLERLVQFHLAGAEWIAGKLLDTHGAPIHKEVWDLTADVIERSNVRALLIERDQTFGPLPQMAKELEKAHKLMQKAEGAGSDLDRRALAVAA